MDWRRLIAGFSVLTLALAGAATAAEDATLADAAEQGHGKLVRTLLAGGADVNAAQVDGMTALHWAAYRDDLDTARMLVEGGADANAVNQLRRAGGCHWLPPTATRPSCGFCSTREPTRTSGCWAARPSS